MSIVQYVRLSRMIEIRNRDALRRSMIFDARCMGSIYCGVRSRLYMHSCILWSKSGASSRWLLRICRRLFLSLDNL